MKKKLIVVAALIIVIAGVLLYLNHMNYWPFQDEKAAGIPDGEIKSVDTTSKKDELSLLLAANGEIAYNVKAKSMSVYFDVYDRDKRVRHDIVTEGMSEENTQMSESLIWGIPGFDVFNATEIRLVMSHGSSSSQIAYAIPKGVFVDGESRSAGTHQFEDGKIEKGKEYVLESWSISKKEGGISSSVFSKDSLKDKDRTVILYVIFK
ncbi:hypothetical protein PWEIH_08861 [Listeria weihenstephanensis FSL R9-0317]|uniref:Uncharacterized protein n=1 Tax=Listeria weihenstephanensis TaxID=1006155 RepID=A0A1S7FT31_9LIST|nr:hypothetical protein [Listeria weihenstephanensis]AQY50601.1 hypothetical protein UE46_05845 [Listeria weihenstephanensis]EUJ38971.1 hypothetical protein PWEIH_08861 [Listeria weihenstephanensis FSL R9-0317]